MSSGTTGNAESIRITFDPKQVSFGQLLRVYFSVMDPTALNYQGPDQGTQYRSAIFTTNADQKRVADAYVAQLGKAHAFSGKIVTEVAPFKGFYQAEDYHQDYLIHHPEPALHRDQRPAEGLDVEEVLSADVARTAGDGVSGTDVKRKNPPSP